MSEKKWTYTLTVIEHTDQGGFHEILLTGCDQENLESQTYDGEPMVHCVKLDGHKIDGEGLDALRAIMSVSDPIWETVDDLLDMAYELGRKTERRKHTTE